MQISPRYDGPPVLDVEYTGDVLMPLLRQRRRLLDTLRGLDDEQWATPSRCEGWTVQDVVSHLVGTDQFWAFSFGAGLRGEPTRVLVGFDPVATPAQMVEGMRALPFQEVLTQFTEKIDALQATLSDLEPHQWDLLAEAPPGHLRLRVAALHALWDGWVHERDIVIPLGLISTEDDEEIGLVLRYAAGLSPAIGTIAGVVQAGKAFVSGTEPSVSLCVEATTSVRVYDGVGDGPCVGGRSVELIEGFSHRAELPHDLSPDDGWFLDGLAKVFDRS